MKGTYIHKQGKMTKGESLILKFAFWYMLFQVLRAIAEGNF